MHPHLDRRREDSRSRLDELRERAKALSPALGDEPLCIYVTGSFGRLEAQIEGGRENASDLDLFFLYDRDDPEAALPPTRWFRLAGQLVDLTEELDFPEFSGDGEYLEVHNVARIAEELGSPTDDSVNAFTARMLLLLESKPVLNEGLYNELIRRVVEFYFADFEKNSQTFRPTFLLNDILRFWRTLTLNYEHKRGEKRRAAARGEAERGWEVKSATQNLKLGFSRLSTCFSMVVPLAGLAPPVTLEHVVELCRLTPTERWENVEDDRIAELLDRYDWFLEATGDKGALTAMLTGAAAEAIAGKDKEFGDLVFTILLATAQKETLRYVVV
jgi:hypothetical protein